MLQMSGMQTCSQTPAVSRADRPSAPSTHLSHLSTPKARGELTFGPSCDCHIGDLLSWHLQTVIKDATEAGEKEGESS